MLGPGAWLAHHAPLNRGTALGGGLNPETTFQALLMTRSEVGIGAMWQHLTANLAAVALFVSGDQLLKGAALNAVQIAELLPAVRAAAAA